MNLAEGLTGVQAVRWTALLPVLAPVVAVVLLLLLDALAPRAVRLRRVHDGVALIGLGAGAAGVLWLAAGGHGGGTVGLGTLCVPARGLALPSCSFVVSPFTLTMQGVVLAAAAICLLLAVDGEAAADRASHHVLLLTATTGALALAGSRDLISLVVAFETASLPAVGLVALRRDARGAQGALTLLLTAVGSLGLLLLGVALLLTATGSVHLDRVATVLADPQLPGTVRAVAVLGALLAVSGVAFKLSAVPFHLWTPDTYAGAPLPVAAFLAVVSKAAGLTAVLVLLTIGLPALGDAWAPVIGWVAAATVTVGNLVALRQRVAVRLLAWSTVAQAGWVLLPLAAAAPAAGTVDGSGPAATGSLTTLVGSGVAGSGLGGSGLGGSGLGGSGLGGSSLVAVGGSAARTAAAASVGYLVAYTVASLAAFSVVVILARHHPAGEQHTLDGYRGLIRREPVACAVLGFALVCLAGLPPGVVGLVAKVIAVRPLVGVGAWPLAVIAAVNVVLGLIYYLRWAALLVAAPQGEPITWRVRPAEGLALGASGAACVALSVWPQAIAGLLPGLLR